MLDDSGSICDVVPPGSRRKRETCDNWQAITSLAARVVEGLNIGPSQTMVGAVVFDTTAVVSWNLTAYVHLTISFDRLTSYFNHRLINLGNYI